eukprot:TRINITY_DN6567_c0_g1_i1.p1 TRINITY_DN6567_c0_g1~~TRINITY_DN6567_c0_g1_i1.p1  ORF type:complete len:234 (-),score=50.54 TRINITY_DN6567_c0_g1_i1:39-740(-)
MKGEYFPEFDMISNNILSLDIVYLDDDPASTDRIVAYGSQDGIVYLTICRENESVLIQKYLDGPITSVKLFSFLNEITGRIQWNLIVGGSVGYCVIFDNIIEEEFLNGTLLEETTTADSVMDVNFRQIEDTTEILVGTYGQQLLSYHLIFTEETYTYEFKWKKMFSHPIYNLRTGSFTDIDKNEIILTTMFGIHLLQENRYSMKQLTAKISLLQRIKEQEKTKQEKDPLILTS